MNLVLRALVGKARTYSAKRDVNLGAMVTDCRLLPRRCGTSVGVAPFALSPEHGMFPFGSDLRMRDPWNDETISNSLSGENSDGRIMAECFNCSVYYCIGLLSSVAGPGRRFTRLLL
jgi:hypothetical protein